LVGNLDALLTAVDLISVISLVSVVVRVIVSLTTSVAGLRAKDTGFCTGGC
jgi:hypothetical protein